MSECLGVIIVTYNSADEIFPCLDALAAAPDVRMKVVIVDNGSQDTTCRNIAAWQPPSHMTVSLHEAKENRGFAAGVNLGLSALLQVPELDRFWILNPDCICTPSTPSELAHWPLRFALLGCRIVYADRKDQIQIDGGTVNFWTGATGNLNMGKSATQTASPDPKEFDFISGASMVASRAFVEAAGPMPEAYFLYYEEVEWAARRGMLPLEFCPAARVHHSAGASIGSATLSRGPSPLSVYFKHRARLRFVARHAPASLPFAYVFGWIKLFQNLARGEQKAALSCFRAIHWLPPSREVRDAISPKRQAATNDLTAETKLS